MPGGLDKSAQFYGKGIEALFPEGSAPKTTVPFPRAGMHKKRAPYEEHLVHAAVSKSPPDSRTWILGRCMQHSPG